MEALMSRDTKMLFRIRYIKSLKWVFTLSSICTPFIIVFIFDDLEIRYVQLRINSFRYWFNLRSKLLLNAAQSVSVLVGDEIDGDTQMAESSRSEKGIAANDRSYIEYC